MPSRLRPVAPFAPDAVLVGDPGRSLLLAQELTEQPKMANHARGLWGYFGHTPGGHGLTVQATGMGGPSAALVLADLAELGVRRAVRVGSCVAVAPEPEPGDLLVVVEAHAWSGGANGEERRPSQALTRRLQTELGEDARAAPIASLDFLHRHDAGGGVAYAERVEAADMQTAGLFATAERLGIEIAAVLIVAESATGEQIGDEQLEAVARRAGRAAAAALPGGSNPQVDS